MIENSLENEKIKKKDRVENKNATALNNKLVCSFLLVRNTRVHVQDRIHNQIQHLLVVLFIVLATD